MRSVVTAALLLCAVLLFNAAAPGPCVAGKCRELDFFVRGKESVAKGMPKWCCFKLSVLDYVYYGPRDDGKICSYAKGLLKEKGKLKPGEYTVFFQGCRNAPTVFCTFR